MRLVESHLILATTDLTTFVRCDHATYLRHAVERGTLKPLAQGPPSPLTALIAEKGDAHEQAYVDRLRAAGKTVVTIEKAPWTRAGLRSAEAQTLDAMHAGADAIYQAAFFDGRWMGYADLLERVEHPSPILGDYSYEVVDTKLARTARAHFVLQLSDYSSHLARLQGARPKSMHVELGSGERVSFRVADYDSYYRRVRASLDRFLELKPTATQYPVEFCALCDWSNHCWKEWNELDHLSLVANIRRAQATRLERADIGTMTALASAPPTLTIRRIPAETFGALNHQARLQVQQKRTGKHTYELLPREEHRGFHRLPRPSPGDVFFDVEGDPFAGEGLTYLFGLAYEENGSPRYHAWWAHDEAEEHVAFEQVVDFIVARRRDDPAAHVYHYGSMEAAILKRLMGRHGTRENEVDDLLRSEAFVDLSAVVRQSMRISQPGYGLKKLETFYFDRTEEGVANAGGAVLAYEHWLETGDEAMLAAIGNYNREDCISIVELRRWLVGIRPDDVTWKEPREPREVTADRLEEEQQNDAVHRALVQQQVPLLPHLLYYHRREERPAWWSWFERREKMTDDELVDDSEPIGRLTLDDTVPPQAHKKSKIFTYRFPPQEHKLDPGDTVHDRTRQAGEIVSIDDANGIVRIKRGPGLLDLPHPDALIPKTVVDSSSLRAALRRFAESLVAHGIESTPYAAARDILLSRDPRCAGGKPLRDLLDAARGLEQSYLFVQGPPGSGKTTRGSEAIVALLRDGKRVGVTSNSHAAIHNLLHAVEDVAQKQGFQFQGFKKGAPFPSSLANPMIETSSDLSDFTDASTALAAGTAWLFSNPAMDQSLDYLFVDEAGQVSLANTLACATAARNVILLGDPLQLAQVSQGSHPEGAGVSVLQHLLGTDATVREHRGIFLEESWRMHPDVCTFISDVVYESRLHSAAECSNQAVTIDGKDETGLRFIAVEHEGNTQSSEEEASRIAAEIRRLLPGSFTSSSGETRQLRPSDFLVVAAYNAQVRKVSHALSAAGLHDVPVGTVDKFQGRQAPIVFFSMATSSGADLPRDLEFLFSRNRLNVAISRARCLAIVVASPHLLEVRCSTPEQMQLVNGLCRFVEMAETSTSAR